MEFLTLPPDILWPLIALLIAIGCVAGFLAGLMGIGGGIILVPGLYYGFASLGFAPESLMHVAVGTSLATMVATGLSSARAHWQRGNVDLVLVRAIGPGIVTGVIIGTLLAGIISGAGLRLFFAAALMGLALIMTVNPDRYLIADTMPRRPWPGVAGAVVGVVSTLMGIGGAVMNVPYMCLHRVPIHCAVGTAAALGLFIAVPGLAGFILIGWGQADLPPLSFGYVNLAAWAVIIPFSVMCAPLGARLAHALPVPALRRVFAFLILVVGARMLLEVLG